MEGASRNAANNNNQKRGGKKKKESNRDFEVLKAPSSIADIGLNLAHRDFKDDLESVLRKAMDSNVTLCVCTGTSMKSSAEVLRLAKKMKGPSEKAVQLYTTVGIHPHDAKTFDKEKTIAKMEELAKDEHVVAIGECGIDYDRMFSPADVQVECFAAQLDLAVKLKKPVFLHQRLGFKEFCETMNKHWPKELASSACVHCFTGSRKELETFLARGYMIGITGFICDKKRGENLRETLKTGVLPLERLMIETDAPFMSPKNIPQVPRRCEPAMLSYVAQELANLIPNTTFEQVCVASFQNTKKFFSLK